MVSFLCLDKKVKTTEQRRQVWVSLPEKKGQVVSRILKMVESMKEMSKLGEGSACIEQILEEYKINNY
jgi:hypothetical protein